MAVPILDLSKQHAPLASAMREAFDQILDTSQFVLGKPTVDFEAALAQACGCEAAVGVSSGTDALILAMMTLGIGAGDEVITSPFTFFASGGSIARMGAKPVFVDIDPVTMNLDPAKIEQAITPQPKAIMPVHLFGLAADMARIGKIASDHNLKVIEDTAQAIGATCCGKQAGTFGDIGCLSFYPTKNLSACGDAGACLVNDSSLEERLRMLRLHGQSAQYLHEHVGGNFRIDALQAALLHIKLPHLETWTDARRNNAARYGELLADLPVERPLEPVGYTHVYHQYTIRVEAEVRDKLAAHLREKQIGFGVFYPVPLHLQPCFAGLGQQEGSLPQAEKAARQVLSLPIFPGLTEDQLQEVVTGISEFFH